MHADKEQGTLSDRDRTGRLGVYQTEGGHHGVTAQQTTAQDRSNDCSQSAELQYIVLLVAVH